MLNSLRADDDALADFREASVLIVAIQWQTSLFLSAHISLFLQKVLKLLRSTEHAVRTYQRSKLWRDAPQQYKGEFLRLSALQFTMSSRCPGHHHPMVLNIGQTMPPQVQELLASPVLLPSPYLEQAIQVDHKLKIILISG